MYPMLFTIITCTQLQQLWFLLLHGRKIWGLFGLWLPDLASHTVTIRAHNLTGNMRQCVWQWSVVHWQCDQLWPRHRTKVQYTSTRVPTGPPLPLPVHHNMADFNCNLEPFNTHISLIYDILKRWIEMNQDACFNLCCVCCVWYLTSLCGTNLHIGCAGGGCDQLSAEQVFHIQSIFTY